MKVRCEPRLALVVRACGVLAAEVAAAERGAVVPLGVALSADGAGAVLAQVDVERRAFGLAGAAGHPSFALINAASNSAPMVWSLLSVRVPHTS